LSLGKAVLTVGHTLYIIVRYNSNYNSN